MFGPESMERPYKGYMIEGGAQSLGPNSKLWVAVGTVLLKRPDSSVLRVHDYRDPMLAYEDGDIAALFGSVVAEISNLHAVQSLKSKEASLRRHVVITGTGRAGTTFLIELLTHLGLDTGFSSSDFGLKNREARAGLERDIRRESCPFIVKSPRFCYYADEVIHRSDIVIEHIFIPVRDLYAAAESRRYVTKANLMMLSMLERLKRRLKPKPFKGGLWKTHSSDPGKQEVILLSQIYQLLLALSHTKIPVTFMHYPRIVKDCGYLYDKLRPILRDNPPETFSAVFRKTVSPNLVHSFGENDRWATG
jgi:hypothetical protein